jgi:hypothetical protein
MIEIDDCKDGCLYFVYARWAKIGIYNKINIGFIISRYKFGGNFLDIEYHYNIGNLQPNMKQYGTVIPLKEIELVPKMDDKSKLIYLNQQWEKLKEERQKYCCIVPNELG